MTTDHNCGECDHFFRYALEENGRCHRYPPTVFASGAQARPLVKMKEKACGEFRLVPEGAKPEFKIKATIPRPEKSKNNPLTSSGR